MEPILRPYSTETDWRMAVESPLSVSYHPVCILGQELSPGSHNILPPDTAHEQPGWWIPTSPHLEGRTRFELEFTPLTAPYDYSLRLEVVFRDPHYPYQPVR